MNSDLLYVHDYGVWHIAVKKVSGAPKSEAICGTSHQAAKPHWASQMHFHEPRGLDIDERSLCGVCAWRWPHVCTNCGAVGVVLNADGFCEGC